MTPKEKALQLVDKFSLVGLQQRQEGIACAIIAVEEILSHITITTNQSGLIRDFQKEYWHEVRTEIENL